ncbi:MULTISPECIES: IS66 family transposase [Bradyrhizobium]
MPPPYPPPTICKHVDQQTAVPTPNLCEWDANVAYAELERFLREQAARLSPGSEMGKAIAYLLNHWDGLTLFLDDGCESYAGNWVMTE